MTQNDEILIMDLHLFDIITVFIHMPNRIGPLSSADPMPIGPVIVNGQFKCIDPQSRPLQMIAVSEENFHQFIRLDFVKFEDS